MRNKAMIYRPRGALLLGWLLCLTCIAVPVLVLLLAESIVGALVLAVVLWPFAYMVYTLSYSQRLKVNDDGVSLVSSSESVTLAWEEIRRFDSLTTLVIYTQQGKAYTVDWVETAPFKRMIGDLGPADYLAIELNAQLMERTGRAAQAEVDVHQRRPKVAAESPVGRERLGKAAAATFTAAALGMIVIARTWWAMLIAVAAVAAAWIMASAKRRPIDE